jgi:hypothetical protein
MVVPMAASLLMFAQAVSTGEAYHTGSIAAYLLFNFGELALAAAYAVVAATSVGVAYLHTTPDRAANPGTSAAPVVAGSRVVAVLATVAATGTVFAAGYALLAAQVYPWPARPFLRWALAAAVPVAVLVVGCGLRLRRAGFTAAYRQLLMPAAPLLLAAVGMLAVQSQPPTGPATADTLTHLTGVGSGGSLLLGVAAGWMLADRLAVRIVAAVPLAGVSLVLSADSPGILAAVVVAAMVSWWMRRAWQITESGAAAAAVARR